MGKSSLTPEHRQELSPGLGGVLVFTKYGKCYMFNSGEDGKPLLTTVKGGTGNGLEIMLDIQQDEYLPIWGETEETTFEAGVKVQIHSQSEPPFIQELGFGVAPGFQTFVATQEQRVSPLGSPRPVVLSLLRPLAEAPGGEMKLPPRRLCKGRHPEIGGMRWLTSVSSTPTPPLWGGPHLPQDGCLDSTGSQREGWHRLTSENKRQRAFDAAGGLSQVIQDDS
ncbi:Hypothetical predicted protein [Marmota monax]|uniref:Uncharacterized protein n=1 Tax=Marmota monax TaxID=9995 RepID=A0A5E4A4E3_MARMO|nr:hypothetical protein GHT09_010323 [Marmota monax]VTJ51561.1 Hypothetical predicted protein [Marmota monax]